MQNCDQIVKFRHHHQSHPSESRADEEGAERGVLGRGFIYWKMQFAYQFEWEQCNRDSNDYTATEQQLLLIAVDPTTAVRRSSSSRRTRTTSSSDGDKTHSTEHARTFANRIIVQQQNIKYQF